MHQLTIERAVPYGLPGIPMNPAWKAQEGGKDHPVPKPRKKAKKAPPKKKK